MRSLFNSFLDFSLASLGMPESSIFFQILQLVAAVVQVAEFFLNRLHLLIQIVLALALLHLFLDPATDALFHFQHIHVGFHQRHQMLDTLAHVDHFQDVLLLFKLELEVGGDGVGQAADLVDGGHRIHDLRCHFFGQLDVFLELGEQRAGQGVLLAFRRHLIVQFADIGDAALLAEAGLADVAAGAALDQHFDGAVGELEHLQDGGHGAHPVNIAFRGIVIGRVALRHQHDLLVAGHGGFQSRNGLLPADEQRDHHMRVDHHVTQWQQRNIFQHVSPLCWFTTINRSRGSIRRDPDVCSLFS